MTGSTSVATIVNPNSASGKTGRSWKRIHGRLEQVCGPVTVYETKAPGHAIELAAEAIDSGHRTLIVVGGDGTVNEVVNGILLKDESPASGITVGLIPQGTGSDLRRALRVPLDEKAAVETLQSGTAASLDVMKVIYRRPDGTDATRYSVNLTSFGMGGAVAARANRSSNPLGGTVTFLVATAVTTLGFGGNRVSIELDEDELKDVLITNVAVGNGQYHGAGMMICPRAVIDDGLLDVTVVEKMSLWEITRSIRMLYDGTIYDHPKVHFRRTKHLVATSEEPSSIEIDGEPLGHLPLEITVLPGALRMIVP